MTYFAKSDGVTTVALHLDAVADLASLYGDEIGLPNAAFLCGQFHDVLKYNDLFQAVLAGDCAGIDHAFSSACALMLLSRDSKFRPVCEVIAAHHSFLIAFDYLDQDFKAFKRNQLSVCPSGKLPAARSVKDIELALKAFLADHPSFKFVASERFYRESIKWKDKLLQMLQTRFLLSCQVDADYSVSAFESSNDRSDLSDGAALNPVESLQLLHEYRFNIISNSKAVSDVNMLRNTVYQDCVIASDDLTTSFWTLTAPTGSGKTLAMLRFALGRCLAEYGSKKRIIIVLPFLSISDQVVEIVRKIIPDVIVDNSQSYDAGVPRDIASKWAAPCIITTTVQFFNSLFSAYPGDCRKLHRIANSVILFDEVQALPIKLSRYLIQSLHYLARYYNSCVVLSTATQPVYQCLSELDFNTREIIRDVKACFAMTSRTQLRFLPERVDLVDIAEMAMHYNNVCVVVNLKRHAVEIFNAWKSRGVENIFLVSTDLCVAHRRMVLREINALQASGQSVHVIATQCIETGVDADFDMMFRALAPLTNLIQCAGRCNRNGRLPQAETIVFEPVPDSDGRRLYPGADYEWQAFLVKNLLASGFDLNDLTGIQEYYSQLFDNFSESQALQNALFSLDYVDMSRQMRLIKNSGYRVIVPYDLDLYQVVWQAVCENRVQKKHLSMTAGITVQSYDLRAIEKHCEELKLVNYRTSVEISTGVYILLPGHELCYDDAMGLQLSMDDMFFI